MCSLPQAAPCALGAQSLLSSTLLAPSNHPILVSGCDAADADEIAAEEVCALYYAEGDPTEGHRSQRATLYVDHAAPSFQFEGAGGEHIEIAQQSDHLRFAGVTGCVVWNGAVVLAKSLTFWDSFVGFSIQGLRVLEFGSGAGALAIAAALLGAHVIATEQEERMKLLRRNLERHAKGGEPPWCLGRRGGTVDLRELDWFAPDVPVPCDLIMATDVVYTEDVTAALVRTLSNYAVPILIAVELRTEEVHMAFISLLVAAGFSVHRLPPLMHPTDVRTRRVVIYVLTRGALNYLK